MPDLTVNVLDDDQDPVVAAKVFLLIHHNFMPDTWLEDRTDDDGEAEFEVPKFTTVDVHVNGNVELEDISIGEDDEDVTVTLD